jgi:2-isopropylmalate synthase
VAARARISAEEIDRAAEALKPAQQPRLKLVVPTSPTFVKYVLKMDEFALLDAIDEAIRYARRLVGDVQLTLEDATRADRSFLAKVCSAAAVAGAGTIVIQDSVGVYTPKEFYDVIRYLKEQSRFLDEVTLGVDCRHDLGLSLANALGAMEKGVEQVECTVGGIGFPLGQVPLEAFVTALYSRPDRYNCTSAVRTEELHRLAVLVQTITGSNGQLWGKVLRDAAISQQEADTHATEAIGPYHLESFRLITDEDGVCSAEAVLKVEGGPDRHGTASGSNQVEALYGAIGHASNIPARVVDHAVNHIRQDCKVVMVWLEDGDLVVTGRGVASTVLRASGDAYVDALCQLQSSRSSGPAGA